MNNEEKILCAIESLATSVGGLTSKVDSLSTAVDSLNTAVDSLTSKVGFLEAKVDTLEQGQAELKGDMQEIRQTVTRIEVEHGKKLDALADGYKANRELYEAIEPRVVQLERVAEKHSLEILALCGAK